GPGSDRHRRARRGARAPPARAVELAQDRRGLTRRRTRRAAPSVGCRGMSTTTRSERIPMPDGGEMGAYIALPESGRGPGILVLMEIFGVGSYIRRAAERLSELGYVALAPDLYRRTDPGAEFDHDQA